MRVSLITESDFTGWRAWARTLLKQHTPSDGIQWEDRPGGLELTPSSARKLPEETPSLHITRDVYALFPAVIASGHPERFTLLYQLLEHLRDDAALLSKTMLWHQLTALAQKTRRSAIALRQALPSSAQQGMYICRVHAAPSLLDSQASALVSLRSEPWLIYTKGRILLYENGQLFFSTSPLSPEALRRDDALLAHARSTAIPVQGSAYWEAILPLSIRPTPTFIEQAPSLDVLRAYAVDCGLCPLCRPASRTVFGEGHPNAALLFVGEQPGDQEDQKGRPFVGPAGQLFDQALHEAGGVRSHTWISNAVKHFNFIRRGNRRIHQKPEAHHIHACAPWLAAERRLLRHRVTVMLGVTGASAVLGRPVRVTRERSRLFTLPDGSTGLITVHPSSLLRQPDERARQQEYVKFTNDLKLALSALA